jgi:hypothetical protein
MDGRRTSGNRAARKILWYVLLVLFLGNAGGCRDGESETSPPASLSFSLNLPAGTRYVYDTWVLDQRYPQLPSSKKRTSWRVVGTQEYYQGMDNVTIIADSTSEGVDSLYLAARPTGDLYMYGYLARLVKRRQGFGIPSRWDLIGSFRVSSSGSWIVGPSDSLGESMVHGSVSSTTEYYTASVDGVMEVFPAYRVDLTGESLYCSIWFTSSPNAIARLMDEAEYQVNGQLQELVSVTSETR